MQTLSILLAFALGQSAPNSPAAKDLVHIPVTTVAEFQQLQILLTDVDDHQAMGASGLARAYATDAEQALLSAANIPYQVVIEDLQSYYAARAATERNQGAAFAPVGSMGGFRTLAEIVTEMDRLAAVYPAICSPKFSVGSTIQGRDIWAMRISSTPTVHDPSKAIAWYDALHHAREPMSGESLLMFANEILAAYGQDADATRLVETRNLLFIPCSNPDGYEHNRQIAPNGGGMWRKNRRNNLDGTYGVDLNRNYAWEWGPQWPGSSSNTSSETYRGTSPFSEPESQALATLMSTMPPAMSMSVHTYSDLMLYPWGYDTVVTPHDALYREFGQSFTAQSGWPFGTIWQVLYIANGGSVDYHYATFGTVAFTPEIGNSNDGFWPAPSRISALYADIQPAFLESAKATGAWAQVEDFVWTEISGDGDAWQEPGESWGLQLQMQNLGLAALDVDFNLTSSNPHLTVSGLPATLHVAPRGSALSTSFQIDITGSAPSGQPLPLQLGLDYNGWISSTEISIILGRQRVLMRDQMETDDFGWSSNMQTNWSWQRADPQATTANGSLVQSGADHSPNGTLCWVTGAASGSSVGSNDVDGTAILTSPIFSLVGHNNATLSYARWFANRPGGPLDDRWVSELSNNGGATWVALENLGDSGSSWDVKEVALHGALPFTNQMRLRFIVADDPNNDITEGMLDDLEIRTLQGSPTLGHWGAAQVGAQNRITIDGDPGASYGLAWSLVTNNGTTYPGIEGRLYLAAPQIFRNGNCAADGVGIADMMVPGAVTGRTVFLQGLVGQGTAGAEFTTVTSVTFP